MPRRRPLVASIFASA